MSAPRATKARKHAIIMDITTLLDKGICIPDPNQFMWIQTKQNYEKHVERTKDQKDINEEEKWAFKGRLVILFTMNQETPMPNIMLEFLNAFVIKGTYIYFGYLDKVYVIKKQMIIDVFGVCLEGYVEDLKGQVSKIVTLQALSSCRITSTNSTRDQWNAKSLSYHTLSNTLQSYLQFIKERK